MAEHQRILTTHTNYLGGASAGILCVGTATVLFPCHEPYSKGEWSRNPIRYSSLCQFYDLVGEESIFADVLLELVEVRDG